jgi:asparagine synthase (glutamine-hydrolysing)
MAYQLFNSRHVGRTADNIWMCGIAGVLVFERARWWPAAAAARAETMASVIAHRGPDDAGVWESSDHAIALAHRRLSIVDLSALGHNPMSWDNGRLWITYNGEIYNFLELRAELEQAGYRFRSRTDTEVVLAAYDRWGLDSVARFAGMFAFALWDGPRRRLWLVRDRIGKKPLYYTHQNGSFSFASELKALASDPEFTRDIDADAVRLYLRYGYIPAPHSIYATARKLPPAHYALHERGRLEIRRYWDPLGYAHNRRPRSTADAEAELEALLTTAVRQRQIADVPLGAFLSGGIDSSLIVALMQEQIASPVRTFTIRFENPHFDEADHAAAVARHLGTEHHERTCSAAEVLHVAERIPDMFDEPFADSSAIPTYLVSAAARDHVTVALSGDGGDELFFGYPRYMHHANHGWILDLPRPLRRAAGIAAGRLPIRRMRRVADVLKSDEIDRYGRFVSWFGVDEVTEVTGAQSPVAPAYAALLARLAAVPQEQRPPLLDLVSYLPDDILAKVDRASMAVGLEVRSPLLDHRVVEFALGLPLSMKRQGSVTKWLLRKLLYKRIPRALLDRPKMGFGVPLSDWFRGPLRQPMDDYCASDDLADLGLDPRPLRMMWKKFKEGQQ